MELSGFGKGLEDSSINDGLDNLGERFGEGSCPMCGGTEWTVLASHVALHATFVAPDSLPEIARLNVAAMFCVQCKFLRTHVLEGLKD